MVKVKWLFLFLFLVMNTFIVANLMIFYGFLVRLRGIRDKDVFKSLEIIGIVKQLEIVKEKYEKAKKKKNREEEIKWLKELNGLVLQLGGVILS